MSDVTALQSSNRTLGVWESGEEAASEPPLGPLQAQTPRRAALLANNLLHSLFRRDIMRSHRNEPFSTHEFYDVVV